MFVLESGSFDSAAAGGVPQMLCDWLNFFSVWIKEITSLMDTESTLYSALQVEITIAV